MIKILSVTLCLSLLCHSQIIKLNVGKPDKCDDNRQRPINSQLSYVHGIIAPLHTNQPAPQPKLCQCGHHYVTETPQTHLPSKEESKGKNGQQICKDDSKHVQHAQPGKQCSCGKEHSGEVCNKCGQANQHCNCGSSTHQDQKPVAQHQVKPLIKSNGQACDKCKGGNCECKDCKCQNCKDKHLHLPLPNILQPIVGAAHLIHA